MPLGLVPALHPIAEKENGKVAPPLGFRGAEGVRAAWRVGEPSFNRTPGRKPTMAQRAGKRYEKAAQGHLVSLFGRDFTPGQWFGYMADGQRRYCQVDGLLCNLAGVVVFEIKYTFTADAYWQLRKLYEPVVRCALGPKRLGLVIMCRSYDPAAAFPEQVQHLELFGDWQKRLMEIGVLQWKP